ncbi:anti-sigma factor [Lederbergia sp. NSJ-179]|uniref:anti-sigma factor n=1 Tax=Lederbergia sp. NSJ-179 TaxID=2931402 RepID=UPI001FCFC92D|nr:anti-sigma factor [Lederbergia sp. NSJ-179]MCJ7841162.1 anti-sigma factor [Lederbergia sp. NSJ-179]
MMCKHWTDEEMIDYILGKSTKQQTTAIQLSIKECNHCRSCYHTWREILPLEEWEQPSPQLKRRVVKSYIAKLKKNRVMVPSFVWKVTALAVLVIALSVALFTDHHSTQELALDQKEASVYEMIPEPSQHTSGYVMVNNRTNEFYLTVDGLLPIIDKDYQAWVKTYDGFQNMGVLQFENGKASIYSDEKQLEKVEYILFSIEPKGGSSSPSQEHSYIIKLIAK